MNSVLEKEASLAKLQLKILDQDDPYHIGIMFLVRTHPEVTKYLIQPPPKKFVEHVLYLARAVESGKKKFFIICEDEELFGYCHITIEEDHLELGWAIHPDFWGRGMGKKSVQLLLEYIFFHNLAENKKILLTVKKDNKRALSLYEKLGFVCVKTHREELTMELRDFL